MQNIYLIYFAGNECIFTICWPVETERYSMFIFHLCPGVSCGFLFIFIIIATVLYLHISNNKGQSTFKLLRGKILAGCFMDHSAEFTSHPIYTLRYLQLTLYLQGGIRALSASVGQCRPVCLTCTFLFSLVPI